MWIGSPNLSTNGAYTEPTARDCDVTLLHKPNRAAWYLARLAAMSPAEVIWRAGRAAGFEPTSPLVGARPQWDGSPWRSTLLLALEPAGAELAADAERIAAGELDLWGHQVRVDPSRIDWHRDPLDSRALAAGSGSVDPKVIWELHRHQHLVPLAAAAALVDREDWAALCLAQLESWIETNPPRDGVGWSSGYETAHRPSLVGTGRPARRRSRTGAAARAHHGAPTSSKPDSSPYLRHVFRRRTTIGSWSCSGSWRSRC